ncbi:hypothetical protein CC1G_09034 [Coprinopsis cinerea okayama7|uniref:Histone H2A C-terminal domain-containing protein n=1 Tax=Coprinopsis cinerea (strain Okayama-7 / 130 / ATCC MYA-4618 / FGSC 9003) TaxID=240176 RepID=A8N9J9_COPC7|nr:hypothetical protein CC1G_09034 [Coprinopsis cinerea okayama7\|eukprot:XP_001831505.2 hypothetical protein CC1G_09034 [Coprinopsis cinerea okayama7\
MAEIIELAGERTKNGKRKRLNPRDISLAIKGDIELNRLFPPWTVIREGGVVPHIHEQLLFKRPKRAPEVSPSTDDEDDDSDDDFEQHPRSYHIDLHQSQDPEQSQPVLASPSTRAILEAHPDR